MTFRELTELQEKSRNAAYERNYAPGGNEWLKPDGSRPDGSRPEMDCGQRWMAAGDG